MSGVTCFILNSLKDCLQRCCGDNDSNSIGLPFGIDEQLLRVLELRHWIPRLAAGATRHRTAPERCKKRSFSGLKMHLAAAKTSLRAIAAGLNDATVPTARGGKWSSPQVMRMLGRLDPFEAAACIAT